MRTRPWPQGPPRCKIYLNAAQTLTTGTTTQMKFDTVIYDPYGMAANLGLATASITIPNGLGGHYDIKAGVSYPANGAADGSRRITIINHNILGNLAQNDAPNILAAVGAQRSVGTDDIIKAGESVLVQGRQDSGGNLITPAGRATFLSVCWIGPLTTV